VIGKGEKGQGKTCLHSLGTMLIKQLVHHKMKVKKQTCASWFNESPSSRQVISLSLKDKNDYNQLLHRFEELHSESNKFVVINNRLK